MNTTADTITSEMVNVTTTAPAVTTAILTAAPITAAAAATTMTPSPLSTLPESVQRDYHQKIHLLQIFILLGYSIMFVLCAVLIGYLRYNRNVALKGDASAARKVLLPAFEPLIWILGVTTGVSSLVVAGTMAANAFETSISSTATEGFYCVRMFVLLTVVVYMMQKSVTLPALLRTITISFVGAVYSLPVELLLTSFQKETVAYKKMRHFTLMATRCLLLVFFTYVFIKPPGRASKRSIREYIVFVYGYYALVLAYNQLLYEGHLDGGFIMVYVTILWASLAPLVMWRVLTADTQHWRGMGQRAVALQSLFRQRHHLNEHVSSQGLHVLIEMHRKFIIDFAYLELKRKIGVGSSAVVFNGVLNSKTPVAIKVYTPSEFDENTVAEFSQEAALCGALNHPNVVKFFGMCVCPPTICLVSELCQGSLDDITVGIASQHQHAHRQQQLINIGYMVDAARAVAYIHSFSPAFVHRDIKPSNFLVDVQNTVKLTDFGESRSLPKSHMIAPPPPLPPQSASLSATAILSASSSSATSGSSGSFAGTTKSLLMKSGATLQQQSGRQSSMVSVDHAQSVKMTVKGTVDYMAPEIIQGRAGVAQYGEAADVYSLAITMWDILNPGKEKFPTIRSNHHLHIFESVVEGKRPLLDHSVHAMLRELIESAWQGEPRLRPRAQTVVSILETIQEELFAVFAGDLSDELDQEETIVRGHSNNNNSRYGDQQQVLLATKSFTAQHAMAKMEELRFVNTPAEALRLGNALMDCGLVHHATHERPFEIGTGVYFFDEDNINLCQPILAHREGDDDDEEDEGEDDGVGHGVAVDNVVGPQDEYDDDDTADVDDDERIDLVVPLPRQDGTTARLGFRNSSGLPLSAATHRPRHLSSSSSSSTRRKQSAMRVTAAMAATTRAANRPATSNGRSEQATTVSDNGICPCRKLGQRLTQPKTGATGNGTSKRRGFLRQRQKPASEEHILTAQLLGMATAGGEPIHAISMATATTAGGGGEFDDFEAVNTNFHQHRDTDGGLA